MSMDGLRSAPAGTNVGAPTNGPANGTSADAARDLQLLSAKELWEFRMKCVKLKDEIVDRNHKGRQGRRAADDTARSSSDRCVSLKRFKLPSEYDQKMLFLGSQRDQSLSKPHRQELALWAQQQQKRNLASQEEALNPRFRKDTLKSYLTTVATEEQTTAMKKGRAKLAYRFTFGDKKDKTLHHVQRTDPSYLRWLFGPENCFEDDESPFTWECDAHWRLFIECQRLCAEHDGQREFRVYPRQGQHPETVMMWKHAIRPELTAAFDDYVANVPYLLLRRALPSLRIVPVAQAGVSPISLAPQAHAATGAWLLGVLMHTIGAQVAAALAKSDSMEVLTD